MVQLHGKPPEAPDFRLVGLKLGPYRLGQEIASGGMAAVHLGCLEGSRGFERLVAIKRIHPHLAREREFVEMFLDEARIAARISHPFVASVTDFGEFEGQPFITMELLLGEPLSRVLAEVTRQPSELAAPHYRLVVTRLIADLCEGLHAAHEVGDERGVSLNVIHRDVSPTNLLVLYDGTPKVLDFGIARARNRLHQTLPGSFKGKLGYVAPEVLLSQPYDRRSDIWSMGVVLWEMLTGARLFSGESEVERLVSVTRGRIAPPSECQPTIPPELEKVTMRALERDPDDRYATARAMARDLERFLGQRGNSVPHADVADWMSALFPGASERKRQLLHRAFDNSSRGRAGEVQQRQEFERVHTGVEPPVSAGDTLASASTESQQAGVQNAELMAALQELRRVPIDTGGLERSPRAPLGLHRTRRRARWVLIGVLGLGGAAALLLAAKTGPIPEAVSLTPAGKWPRGPMYIRSAPVLAPPPAPAAAVPTPEPPAAPAGEAPLRPGRKEIAAPGGPRPVNVPAHVSAVSGPAVEVPPVPARGQLLVRSADGPAEIFYNGRRLTATPALLTFLAGLHELQIRALGGTELIPVTVSVKAGETVVYDVRQVKGGD
jgi:eukaryotic-like serine/threonine-protein kinase